MWCLSRGCRIVAIALIVACGPSVPASDDGTSDTGDPDPTTSEGEPSVPPAGPTTTDGSSTAAPGDEAATTDGSSSGGDIMSSTGSDSTGVGCPETIACGNSIFGCGDGLDNDGDGSIDLEDPECVSPCDDDEAAFRPALPGDWSCLADCFFDGNSGHGDDTCLHDLRCDPLEPVWSCEYDPHPQCGPRIQTPTPECIAFCEPFVPNGCDCFGCCAFQTPDGPRNLFVDSKGCSAGDLAACTECTPVETCLNPCEADACEICIGQTGPPRGCDAPGCVGGTACTSHCDCEPGGACVTGCCIPPPPG